MTIHTAIPQIGLGTYMMSPEEASEMTYEAIKIGYRHNSLSLGPRYNSNH